MDCLDILYSQFCHCVNKIEKPSVPHCWHPLEETHGLRIPSLPVSSWCWKDFCHLTWTRSSGDRCCQNIVTSALSRHFIWNTQVLQSSGNWTSTQQNRLLDGFFVYLPINACMSEFSWGLFSLWHVIWSCREKTQSPYLTLTIGGLRYLLKSASQMCSWSPWLWVGWSNGCQVRVNVWRLNDWLKGRSDSAKGFRNYTQVWGPMVDIPLTEKRSLKQEPV